MNNEQIIQGLQNIALSTSNKQKAVIPNPSYKPSGNFPEISWIQCEASQLGLEQKDLEDQIFNVQALNDLLSSYNATKDLDKILGGYQRIQLIQFQLAKYWGIKDTESKDKALCLIAMNIEGRNPLSSGSANLEYTDYIPQFDGMFDNSNDPFSFRNYIQSQMSGQNQTPEEYLREQLLDPHWN